ncbi:hypothetical protein ACROYT_G039637 [Oculina patagonica]
MADWVSILSALVIVGCFLLLGRFIIRLGVMEREAMFDYVNLPPREIPSQHMVGVKNPFLLKLKSADQKKNSTNPGVIEFLLSTTVPCYATFYWEVRKTAIDAALCEENKQQRSTFDDSQDDSNDSDLEEAPSMSVIPLEHILQGSYKDRSASEFYDSGSDVEISAVPASDAEYESPTSSNVTTSSLTYALVVTVEMCGRDELGTQQLTDIVALITAINFSHSPAGKCTSSIAMQCVQTAEGKIYSMKKLFVVESDDNTETQTLSSSQSTSTQVASSSSSLSSSPEDISFSPLSDLINAVCIVCRALPVTRAFLPCRHACVCGLCFQQLKYCPMCRGVIQSYFKVQDEPFIDDAESDVSTELNRMSVGEILRGVFSAS